tara:strand:- start:40594 stop:41415 length:822 start_codon:yes stop_codon:yes gene_type:complete
MNANKEAKELLGMSPEGLEEYIADELSAIDTTGDRKRSAYLGMALRVLREIRGGGVRDAKELATAFSKVASDLIERAAPLTQSQEVEVEESFWQSIAGDVSHKQPSVENHTFLGGVEQRAKNLELDPVSREVEVNEKAKELARQVLKEVPKEARKAAEKRKYRENVRSVPFRREKERVEKARKYFQLRVDGIGREDAAAMVKINRTTARKYDTNGPEGLKVQAKYAEHENPKLRIQPIVISGWPTADVVERLQMDSIKLERKIRAQEKLKLNQ